MATLTKEWKGSFAPYDESSRLRRFKRCYEKRALDCVEEKIAGRKKRIDFSITLLSPKKGRLLDIGSADGLLIETLGANVAIGTDISIKYCKRMKNKGMEVVNCVAEYLPFANQTFDAVTCTEVLEHVLYPTEVINEIYRVLKNKAYLFLSVPYREKLATHNCYKYEFAHLRTFDEEIIKTLSDVFFVRSVKFYAFRIIYIRFYDFFINRVLNAIWKSHSLRSFFVNYHRHMKFLNKARHIKPTYMMTLAVKRDDAFGNV